MMRWRSHEHDPDAKVDAALIERVLEGETGQFEPLVRRYQAELYRFAVSMVLDHDAAADMVQDAFIRAYSNLGRCRDRMRFRAWLFQTLRHRCLDYLREPRRRHVALDQAADVVAKAETPLARLERQRLRAALADALATLPIAQREAFMLREVDGLPYDAMSAMLGVSVSALKMRVARARAALAAALAGHDVTEPVVALLSFRRG